MKTRKSKLTKQEKAEYQLWLKNHQQSIKKITKAELLKKDKDFWETKSKEINNLITRRIDYKSIPSLLTAPEQKHINKDVDIDPILKEELLKREEKAKLETEKLKSRIAPVYNKGNYVLWTDGMLEDIKTGGHRRR